jgi:hypothetical protein
LATSAAAGTNTRAVTTADLKGEGTKDIAVANSAGNQVDIFTGSTG